MNGMATKTEMRSRAGLFRRAALSAAAAAMMLGSAGDALAKICDMRVYHASNGQQLKEADMVFFKNDEFIVCVTAVKDGYISLWDRIPLDGPVERLSPSPKFEEGKKSRKIAANGRQCFGNGKVEEGDTPYKLLMEAKDGVGVGRMWLVYSESAADHPDVDTFDSQTAFRNTYYEKRFGAGSMSLDKKEGDSDVELGQAKDCTEAKSSLEYFYRVKARAES